MAPGSEDKNQQARGLCEEAAWTELLKLARDWHAENPRDAKALFYRGVALAATGRFVEAETIYRLALGIDPADFKTWNNLAGVLFDSLDKPMDAVRCMEQAMKLEPQNKLGWSNLASMVGRLAAREGAGIRRPRACARPANGRGAFAQGRRREGARQNRNRPGSFGNAGDRRGGKIPACAVKRIFATDGHGFNGYHFICIHSHRHSRFNKETSKTGVLRRKSLFLVSL